jgi:TolB-like protein
LTETVGSIAYRGVGVHEAEHKKMQNPPKQFFQAGAMPRQSFIFGPFLLDPDRGMLFRDGSPVALGRRGLLLLHALLKAQGQLVTKAELLHSAWPNSVVEESNLSVQMASLRKLLGPSPDGADWIGTVPRIGYRFAGSVIVDDGQGDASAGNQATDLARKPSIAVLPFTNLSGDPEQEHFADGITEDVITALSRFRWFFVAARNSSFNYKGKAIDVKQMARELGVRYMVEGSVRKSVKRVRISAQLIDAGSGNQILANRYDFDCVDILAMQDQIAERVAGATEPELLRSESKLAATRRRGSNMNAWDLVRQGIWYLHQVTQATHLRARELFRQARRLDADLPEGHIWLAHASAEIVGYAWSDNPAADAREGMNAALTAIQMDEKSPYCHCALAIASVYEGALDQAVRAAERAVELCPSFALGYFVLGMARLFSGEAPKAIGPLEYGLRLNSYDPQNFIWCNLLALAYFFDKKTDMALQCAESALKIRPKWRSTLETVACCDVVLGRAEAARMCIEQMARVEDPLGDALAPLKRRNPHWTREMTALLRKAGWSRSAI